MNTILSEAKRLHDLGLGLLLLHPKSKRPKENGWTTGPRAPWKDFANSYQDGDNIGVRLGEPSIIDGKFLACIDVDVKDPKYKTVAESRLKEIIGDQKYPLVESGSGNGSKHLYCLTPKPFSMITAAKEKDKYEIVIYSSGRQMVLAPSIHPSGNPYRWRNLLKRKTDLPTVAVDHFAQFQIIPQKAVGAVNETNTVTIEKDKTPFKFTPVKVDLLLAPISDTIRNMIVDGKGVKDRSGALLPICTALVKAGMTQDQILSVVTNQDYFIGGVGFDHAQTKNQARAAFWVYRYTLKRVVSENGPGNLFKTPPAEYRELSFDELTEQENLVESLNDWRFDLDRTEQGNYKSNIRNVVKILENDDSVGAHVLKRDLFALRDFYAKSTPWGGVKGEALSDDDVSKIRHWFSNNYGFEPNVNVVEASLVVVATNNQFDPVAEWLKALPEWDDVPRLDSWLKNHFGGKGPDEYLAQVFRKWICAMVLRIIKPGAKFDWMPIFEGGQGIGKSSFGRILVGDKYFLDWLPDLNNKDSALSLQGIWAVEMGELAQFRKTELESVKAYVTRTVDKFRPPHGRKNIEAPRRCVFFGTTNNDAYLRDETGNRRFKPVNVGHLDFEQLKEDRLQLFAEALWLLNTGFESEQTLDLDGDAKVFEHQIQQEKLVKDDSNVMFNLIENWLEKIDKMDPKERPDLGRFFLEDLFLKGRFGLVTSPLDFWKLDHRSAQFASKALKMAGFEKGRTNKERFWKRKSDGV